MPSSNTELLFVLPGIAEKQRPSALASLRAIEALKPVLPRVVLAHTWLPGALRAGEGPNGWVRIGGTRMRAAMASTFQTFLLRSVHQ